MGWLFGRRNKVPKVPLPKGSPIDDKALRFPTAPMPDKVIEPGKIKEAAGYDQMSFPEEEFAERGEMEFSGKASALKPRVTSEMRPRLPQPEGQELYVKMDVYQRILLEIEAATEKIDELYEINKSLEVSEYNEKDNFSHLRRLVKSLHDQLLHIDKTLFKA